MTPKCSLDGKRFVMWFDRRTIVTLVALAYGLVLAIGFVSVRGGVSQLVHAGPPHTDPADAPPYLAVGSPDRAFDGQFYFRLARGPLSTADEVDGVRFDEPALRSARVGYPLLAGALSLGRGRWVPETLLLVNVLGFAAIGFLGATLAQASGRHAAVGLIIIAYPGFVYSLGFDLAEIIATAALLAGLVAIRVRRFELAAMAWTLAILTRETTLVVIIPYGIAVVMVALDHNKRSEVTWRTFLPAVVPTTIFAGWQAVVWSRWGTIPLLSSGGKNLRLPFIGLGRAWHRYWPPSSGETIYRLAMLGFLVVVAGLTALTIKTSAAPRATKFAWVAALVLMTMISEYPLDGATSFLRGTTEFYVLSAVIVLSAARTGMNSRRLTALFAVGAAGASSLTVVGEIAKSH